jgi:hypothetical protein
MSLLRPTNEFARGSGVSPVAPAAGGWITISNGDLTAVQGSYTGFALSASPTAFENRIAIAEAHDSMNTHLTVATAASIYYDTGIALSTLLNYKGVIASIRMECDMDSTFNGWADTAGSFTVGPFVGNNAPATAGIGLFGGFTLNKQFANRIFNLNLGRFGTDASVTSTATLSPAYDQANDRYETCQLALTGRPTGTAASPTFSFVSADLGHEFYDASATRTIGTDTWSTKYATNKSATGNLIIGAMFTQEDRGTPLAKTFDFDLRYLLEFVS